MVLWVCGCNQWLVLVIWWVIWVGCENNGYSRLFPPRNSRIGVVLVRPRLWMGGGS